MRNLLFLLILGLVVYATISLIQRTRRGPAGGSPRGGRRRPAPPSGPVAPDDDPAFLWQLEQLRRRAERDAKDPDPDDDDGSGQDQPGPRGTTP